MTHWKRLWCWEGLGAGEGDDRGWDGWMASLDGHEFGWTPGVGDGQGGLACCDSWGRKESDTTEQLNWTEWKVGCRIRNVKGLQTFWLSNWYNRVAIYWDGETIERPNQVEGQIRHLVLDTSCFKVGHVYVK